MENNDTLVSSFLEDSDFFRDPEIYDDLDSDKTCFEADLADEIKIFLKEKGLHAAPSNFNHIESEKINFESHKKRELRRIEEARDMTSFHSNSNFFEVVKNMIDRCPDQPFYFLDEKDLFERALLFQKYFGCIEDDKLVAYAMKANPLPRIIEILKAAGVDSFDCASVGEIIRICEMSPESQIFYNNPLRRSKDIVEALRSGVNHFTVDTRYQVNEILKQVELMGTDLELSVRINPINPEDSSSTIHLGEKFGLSLSDGLKLLSELHEEYKFSPGVSIHIGSQNFDPKSHADQINLLLQGLDNAGIKNINSINIGGGIPVNLESSKFENKVSLASYLNALKKSVQEVCNRVLLPGGKCIIEPGRSMVAPAVDLIVPICEVLKGNRGNVLRIWDGIFTSFSDASIHNWEYVFKAFDKDGNILDGACETYYLHGRSCDSGDSMQGIRLPQNIKEGDYLWVPNAGAYLASQSTHFNGFEPHNYVTYNSI